QLLFLLQPSLRLLSFRRRPFRRQLFPPPPFQQPPFARRLFPRLSSRQLLSRRPPPLCVLAPDVAALSGQPVCGPLRDAPFLQPLRRRDELFPLAHVFYVQPPAQFRGPVA